MTDIATIRPTIPSNFFSSLPNSSTSKSGKRPEFDLVTGISTGALAAPFVFLGPSYDRQLKDVYTRYGTDDLIAPQFIVGLLGGSAITDNSKLANVIAKYVDRKLPSLANTVAAAAF